MRTIANMIWFIFSGFWAWLVLVFYRYFAVLNDYWYPFWPSML